MYKLPTSSCQLSILVLSSTLALTLYGCGGNGSDDTSAAGTSVNANQSAECTAEGSGTGTATGTGAGTGASTGTGTATGTGSGTGSGTGTGTGTGSGTGAPPSAGPTGTPLDAVLAPLAGVVGQLMSLGGAQTTSIKAVEEGSQGNASSSDSDAAANSGVSATTTASGVGCTGSGSAGGTSGGSGTGTTGTGSAIGSEGATSSGTGSGSGSGSSSGSGTGSSTGSSTTPSVGGGFVRTAGTLTECFPTDYNTTGKMVNLSYNGKDPSGATYTLTQDYTVQDGKLDNYPSSKLYKTRQVITIFGTVTDQLVDLYTLAIGSTAEQYGFNSVTTLSGQRATLDERYVPKYVLNYDLKVGESSEALYTIESKGTAPNGQASSGSKQASYKIKYLGNTTVTVPAGTFVNACQVEINSNGNVAIQTVSRNTGLMVRLSRPDGFVLQELVTAKVNGAAVTN